VDFDGNPHYVLNVLPEDSKDVYSYGTYAWLITNHKRDVIMYFVPLEPSVEVSIKDRPVCEYNNIVIAMPPQALLLIIHVIHAPHSIGTKQRL
jgi:hypothetical protein